MSASFLRALLDEVEPTQPPEAVREWQALHETQRLATRWSLETLDWLLAVLEEQPTISGRELAEWVCETALESDLTLSVRRDVGRARRELRRADA